VKRGRAPTGWELSGTGAGGEVLFVFREQPHHARQTTKITNDEVFMNSEAC